MHELLTWSSIFYLISGLVLVLVTLYVLLVLYLYILDKKRLNVEYRVEIFDDGLEVYSKKKGKFSFFLYEDISAIRVLNTYPLSYSALVLTDGNIIYLFATASYPFLYKLQKKNIDIPIECEEGTEWRIDKLDINYTTVKEENH